MTALSVNLNKIALIRNSRTGNYPSVIAHAKTAIESGANGITVHPRPDLRHIQPMDVYELAELLKQTTSVEFNIEGNPFAKPTNDYPGLTALVEQTRPDQCTLVPDSHAQLTSDHGFDLTKSAQQLEPVIQHLKELGVRISLFMDPIEEQIELAKAIGADRIELYTGPYAHDFLQSSPTLENSLQRYIDAAQLANNIGLGVNAGHDLNLLNLPLFMQVPALAEVSIGHALIVDAIQMGLGNAIKAYLNVLSQDD